MFMILPDSQDTASPAAVALSNHHGTIQWCHERAARAIIIGVRFAASRSFNFLQFLQSGLSPVPETRWCGGILTPSPHLAFVW